MINNIKPVVLSASSVQLQNCKRDPKSSYQHQRIKWNNEKKSFCSCTISVQVFVSLLIDWSWKSKRSACLQDWRQNPEVYRHDGLSRHLQWQLLHEAFLCHACFTYASCKVILEKWNFLSLNIYFLKISL